jgi:hypothetical protein
VLHLRLPKSPVSIERTIGHVGPMSSLLDSAGRWMSSKLDGIENPGMRLDIGLPPDADLLYGHKLHLYAIALADRSKARDGGQFNSVKITKRHCSSTRLSVASAIPEQPPGDAFAITIKTRKSYAKSGFGQVIRENTQSIRDFAIDGGPLRLTVAYVTGLPRTWSRLWEPTIAGIFGYRNPEGPTGADSSQIVELGFDHCSIGETFEHQVQLTISASPVPLGR